MSKPPGGQGNSHVKTDYGDAGRKFLKNTLKGTVKATRLSFDGRGSNMYWILFTQYCLLRSVNSFDGTIISLTCLLPGAAKIELLKKIKRKNFLSKELPQKSTIEELSFEYFIHRLKKLEPPCTA